MDLEGEPPKTIAKHFSISTVQVRRILRGERRPITFGVYQALAEKTAPTDKDKEKRLVTAMLGLGGESGEVLDLFKKKYGHGHDIDNRELLEELSDVFWYLAEIATVLGISLDEVAWENVYKLKKRYPDGFSAYRSRNRVEYKNGDDR